MPGYSVLFPPLAALLGPAARRGAERGRRRLALRAPRARHSTAARVAALWFAVATVTTLITGRLTFALGVAVGLGGGARRRARAPRAGPARWPRSRASRARWPAPSWRWRPRPGGWTARAGGRWRSRRAPSVPAARAGHRLPRGRQLPVRRDRASGRRWPRRSPSGLVVPARRARGAHRRRALRRGDGRELRAGHADGRQRRAPRRALRRAGRSPPSLWRTQPPRPRPARAAAAVLAVGRAGRRLGAGRRRRVRARALLRRAARASSARSAAAPFRVEIPFTDNHWESRWVAPHVPLARGWERQVDRQRNALFYDGRPITRGALPPLARRQRRALRRPGRRADRLLGGARGPARARRAPPYLREVWHDAHWRVFAVAGARPLASGAARVTAVEPERVRLTASRPGRGRPARALHAVLADRDRPRLRRRRAPAAGRGCASSAPARWSLEASFALGRVRASAPRCTD